jgi:hypothetical protein
MSIVFSDTGKKRGRKPKGAKILQTDAAMTFKPNDTKQNLIVHLKCSLNDADGSINFSDAHEANVYTQNYMEIKDADVKDMSENTLSSKIKLLDHHLHNNFHVNKFSACFWCTHDFDTNTVHIPKYIMNGVYNVYGVFCCPECAAGFLMQETLDTSTKYERYALLNSLYSEIYKYTTLIKPAPNPLYCLEKFSGNLTIKEYRQMCRSERLYVCIEKPVTKLMPEYHEDNDEYIITNKIIPNKDVNVYSKKKKISMVNLNFSKV